MALLETIPKAVINLNQNLDSITAADILRGLVYQPYLATATASSLSFVQNKMLSVLAGRRPNAQALVFAMLGAESQESFAAVNASASSLHATGTDVIVIGTNSTPQLQLEMDTIATAISDVYSENWLLPLTIPELQSRFLNAIFANLVAPPLTYCSTFRTVDVVLVLSMSGRTGPQVSTQFLQLSEQIANLLPLDSVHAE